MSRNSILIIQSSTQPSLGSPGAGHIKWRGLCRASSIVIPLCATEIKYAEIWDCFDKNIPDPLAIIYVICRNSAAFPLVTFTFDQPDDPMARPPTTLVVRYGLA
ncbi:hypothetical protein MY1884_007432 [Beauveria asiatica]